MAEVKKPEAPRPATPAAKSATAVPAKAAAVPAKAVAVPAKSGAVPARAGAVPVRAAAPVAKSVGVPAKTAAGSAAIPAKAAAGSAAIPAKAAAVAAAATAPANTAAAPAKPGLAGKAGTAVATDVASKDLATPDTVKATTAVTKAPDDKDKPAAADAAGADAEPQNFEEMRNKFKPAKKSVAIPTELLGNAKSYDDKLILVKILTEKEQNRVVLMVKNMLRSTNAEKKK